MFRDEFKANLLELSGPKLIARVAANVAKENQRLARQVRNETKLKKKAIKSSKKDLMVLTASNKHKNREWLSLLPSAPLYPVAERREQIIKQRHRVSKKSKKTAKKVAADKTKAARLARMREVRETRKWKAELTAAAEQEARDRKAAHAAFIAAKEAEPPMKITFVENANQVRDMVDMVVSLANAALYLDAEGISLSRDGTMVFLQMYVDTQTGPHTYVIDVWTLKTDVTFLTSGNNNPDTTFKSILEDPAIPKLFWDCRMDSEALYAQHQISLAGVLDVQLMEVARRSPGRSFSFIRGYAKCVDRDAGLDWWDAWKMARAKSAKDLFIPNCGGSWSMLTDRPIDKRILDYCAGDVLHMAKLFEVYARWLRNKDRPYNAADGHPLDKPADFFADHGYEWSRKAVEESARRVERSQNEGWDREVDNMTCSPWQNERVTFDYGYWD